MRWYYYLHTNGDLIGKNPVAVDSDPQYFDSPFVKTFWHIETEDRGDAWRVVLEALAQGARTDRVKELAEKWKLTKEDAFEMMVRTPDVSGMRKEGLTRFIKEILGMTADGFFEEFIAWGKKREAEKKSV